LGASRLAGKQLFVSTLEPQKRRERTSGEGRAAWLGVVLGQPSNQVRKRLIGPPSLTSRSRSLVNARIALVTTNVTGSPERKFKRTFNIIGFKNYLEDEKLCNLYLVNISQGFINKIQGSCGDEIMLHFPSGISAVSGQFRLNSTRGSPAPMITHNQRIQ
jgi:hypothetical protein